MVSYKTGDTLFHEPKWNPYSIIEWRNIDLQRHDVIMGYIPLIQIVVLSAPPVISVRKSINIF